jgi:hypothetical protein
MNETDGSATAGQQAVPAEKRYAEICSNIRATDEISFKLLGLVPLVSGTGIVVLLGRPARALLIGRVMPGQVE